MTTLLFWILTIAFLIKSLYLQKPHSTSSQPSQALQSTLRLSLNPISSSRLTSSEFLNFLQTAIAARALSSGASALVCPVCERWYEHSIKLLISNQWFAMFFLLEKEHPLKFPTCNFTCSEKSPNHVSIFAMRSSSSCKLGSPRSAFRSSRWKRLTQIPESVHLNFKLFIFPKENWDFAFFSFNEMSVFTVKKTLVYWTLQVLEYCLRVFSGDPWFSIQLHDQRKESNFSRVNFNFIPGFLSEHLN